MKVASILIGIFNSFQKTTPSQGRYSEALVSLKTLWEGRVLLHFKL